MKRIIIIYFFVVMTMLLAGCGSGNVIENKTNKLAESKSNNSTSYKVNIKEYIAYNEKDKPFKVKYAQILGIDNKSLENKINQTLKSAITEWLNKSSEWMEKSQITIKCKNSRYISLCYTIEWKNDNGEGFMSTYTRIGVTVDVQTGDRVYLNDLIKNSESLK